LLAMMAVGLTKTMFILVATFLFQGLTVRRFPSQGCSMVVAANRVTGGIISTSFVSLSKGIGIGRGFFLYGGIA
ncbi:polyol transporter 1, partial [Dorcoceras hygrometricum]